MNKRINLEVLGLEELNEVEAVSIEGGFNEAAYGAGVSSGRVVGRALAAVALLCFYLT